jgi:DNA anti-recombination protein RmuC|tara:strand:- start:15418 stop:15552 length:135 start_codon:yes stop_codon:yes gene_type:complete
MIKKLDYKQELTIEEAENRYKEIKEEFEKVKSNYSGFLQDLEKI